MNPVHFRSCLVMIPAMICLHWIAPTGTQAATAPHVEWQFKGKLDAYTPDGDLKTMSFDEPGNDAHASLTKILEFVSVDFNANTQASPSSQQLKTGPNILMNVGIWEDTRVIAQSLAQYSDRLTVNSIAVGSGFLEFSWSVDGKFTAEATKTGPASNGPFGWSYYQETELFVVSSTNGRESVFKDFQLHGFTSPGVANFTDFFEDAFPGGLEDRNHVLDEKTVDSGTHTKHILVPFSAGTAVDLQFNLFAGINIATHNIDYTGGAAFFHKNDFHNTATLDFFNVLDSNLNPISDFSLLSEAGLTYPTGAIPEPTHALLWLAAAMTATLRRGRGH